MQAPGRYQFADRISRFRLTPPGITGYAVRSGANGLSGLVSMLSFGHRVVVAQLPASPRAGSPGIPSGGRGRKEQDRDPAPQKAALGKCGEYRETARRHRRPARRDHPHPVAAGASYPPSREVVQVGGPSNCGQAYQVTR